MTASPRPDQPPDPLDHTSSGSERGLSLGTFRGLRPTATGDALGRLLCPPYDVIDAARRAELLAADPDNAVAVILPDPTPQGYETAADTLDRWQASGRLATDDVASLYVYEMVEPDGHRTRGLLGAVELRDPADGVILPHENTMAGPVTDRLAVMTATGTDLEPIYLVYDGGGAASRLVADMRDQDALVTTTTPDGTRHTLWQVVAPAAHADVETDLAGRHALIADGHHRYATYRERQRRAADPGGPADRGLALLVDTSEYGPQVHPIHRVVSGLSLADAVAGLADWATVESIDSVEAGLTRLDTVSGFAAVLTDGTTHHVVHDADGRLADAAAGGGADDALAGLDVSVLHRAVIERAWGLTDDEETVGYAHDVAEAVANAAAGTGFAVLVRATPVSAVAAVAAAGGRMPRKSTLFTPKPASGLVMRRLTDQGDRADRTG